MDNVNNVLDETIPSGSSGISFSGSSTNSSPNESERIINEESDSDATQLFISDSLPYQIYNYVYNKKPEFTLMYTPFWDAFKLFHPNVSLSSIELKMHFFENVLPGFKNFDHLTSYQRKYFDTMYDFYKRFNIEIFRINDPIPGIHYHRADDNDTFLGLLNQPDVNIIGMTKNVNYDIYSEANTNQLFQMNESMKLCYSAFLRNADEIQNNVLLEHDEITKRLRNYIAEDKTLPSISEINEILKSTAPLNVSFSSTSSSFNYSRTSSRINLPSISVTGAREELTRFFDSLGPSKERKPKRDTKTLRRMQDSLRNPKLKELERKAKAAKRRYREYLK